MKSALAPLIVAELVLCAAREAAAPIALGGAAPERAYDGLILERAQHARLNPRFVKAIVATESEYRPRACSLRGARGLMQLMPATAAEMGVPARSLSEPGANLTAGTAYLNWLYGAARRRYGLRAARLQDAPSWVQRRVVAAYNGGPRLLYRDQWPRETCCYVRKVMRLCRPRTRAA